MTLFILSVILATILMKSYGEQILLKITRKDKDVIGLFVPVRLMSKSLCERFNAELENEKCTCSDKKSTFHVVDAKYGCYSTTEIDPDCNTTRDVIQLKRDSQTTTWKSDLVRHSLGRTSESHQICNNSQIYLDNHHFDVDLQIDFGNNNGYKLQIYQGFTSSIDFQRIQGSVMKLKSSCFKSNGGCMVLKASGDRIYSISPTTTRTVEESLSTTAMTAKKSTEVTPLTKYLTSATNKWLSTPKLQKSTLPPLGKKQSSKSANHTEILIGVVFAVIFTTLLVVIVIVKRCKNDIENKNPCNTDKKSTAARENDYSNLSPPCAIYEDPEAHQMDKSAEDDTYRGLDLRENVAGAYAQLSLSSNVGLPNEPVYLETEPVYAVTEPEHATTEPEYAVTEPEYALTKPEYATTEPEYVVTEPEYAVTKSENATTEPECMQ